MPTRRELDQYRASLQDEIDAAALYDAVAEKEQNPKIGEVYRRMAATERSHAESFAKRLREAGAKVPPFRTSWRTRVLIWLARRFGTQVVLPTMMSQEQMNSDRYAGQPEIAAMMGEEQSHMRLLSQISQASGGGGLEGGAVAQLEGRHRSAGGNALRAAVLGASDGLLSNFNLVMGVAGAQLSNQTILLTGLAGLLAGAISMALGEWISVQSSRELYLKQIRTEEEEIATAPEEELEELVLIYQARGLDEAAARRLATQIMSNQETALQALVRDELGVDPEELGGSAWEAAIASFLLFAVGAIVPVFPYFFLAGMVAVIMSVVLSAGALFLTGAAITLFTGRSVLYSGTRQVLFGLAAAAAVYLIGHLAGVSIAG
jgi:VIT1/CCC1 family predicted Fe2+/Mn2+ transporter